MHTTDIYLLKMKMIEHHIQITIFQKQKKKNYIVMIDGKNVFVQPINAKLKIMEISEKLLVVREIT